MKSYPEDVLGNPADYAPLYEVGWGDRCVVHVDPIREPEITLKVYFKPNEVEGKWFWQETRREMH